MALTNCFRELTHKVNDIAKSEEMSNEVKAEALNDFFLENVAPFIKKVQQSLVDAQALEQLSDSQAETYF